MNRKALLLILTLFSLLSFSISVVYAWPPAHYPISVNEVYCTGISPNEDKYFSFNANSGTTYWISANPDGNVDVWLGLYDSNGTLIKSTDSNGNGGTEWFTITINTTDTYYIDVYSSSGQGNFTILVSTNGDLAPEPNCGNNNGGGDNGGGSSGSCPCQGVPFPCSCGIGAFNPCHVLATLYCAMSSFVSSITNALNAVKDAIVGFFTGIVNSIQEFFNMLKNAIMSIVTGITNTVSYFFNTILNGIEAIGNGIMSFFQSIANGIREFAQTLGSALGNMVHGVIDFFSGLIHALVDAITSFLNGIKNGLGDVVGGVGGFLGNNGILLLGIIVTMIGLVVGAVPLTGLGIFLIIIGLIQRGTLEWWMLLAGAGVLLIGAGVLKR